MAFKLVAMKWDDGVECAPWAADKIKEIVIVGDDGIRRTFTHDGHQRVSVPCITATVEPDVSHSSNSQELI